MPQNLVPGGARRGRFVTRLNRIVELRRQVEVDAPLEPGQVVPVKKILWEGDLYNQDGRTIDSQKHWEPSGAYAEMNGVASPLDLATVIRIDPEPEQQAAELPKLEAPEPEAAEPAKKTEKKSDKAA